ncbi:MAG: alpha/beta fold hydrolase [Gammaproteobacteria bacterium]|nr:alpha/beta fold hydrolase [Gammaproteobacteria bacterium]
MTSRFEYPFKSHFTTVDGIKIHYLDEGRGPVVWLMHGNTSWSYLYRRIIPILVEAGYRCFVPDLMGFGLSDIPEKESDYSLQKQVGLMSELIKRLELRNIVAVGQDWGGPISLRYAIEHKDNIKGLVILNTFIERFPSSRKERKEKNIITGPLPPGFTLLFKSGAYSSFLIRYLDLFRKFVWMKWRSGNPSILLGAGFRRPVDPRAMQNYLMIHDKPSKRAGLAVFPKLIPNHAEHPNAAYIDEIKKELEHWNLPVQLIWPDGDMAWKTDEGVRIAQQLPDAAFYLVQNAGHFLQEDAGEEVAGQLVSFLNSRVYPDKS